MTFQNSQWQNPPEADKEPDAGDDKNGGGEEKSDE